MQFVFTQGCRWLQPVIGNHEPLDYISDLCILRVVIPEIVYQKRSHNGIHQQYLKGGDHPFQR